MSAVSYNVMPSSTARRMVSTDSASFGVPCIAVIPIVPSPSTDVVRLGRAVRPSPAPGSA